MRRPDIELSDAAARYVEEHPAVIEKLANGIPDDEQQQLRQKIRAQLRTRLHDGRVYAESAEGRAAGEAWLAQFGLTASQVR